MSESDNSALQEAYTKSKTVSLADLEKLKSEPAWTIVCIKELMNKPYILLGDEKTEPKDRMWVCYTGDTKEHMLQYFHWMDESKKLYAAKARSSAEMDELRQVMLSIGVLADLFKDDEYIENTTKCALTKIAMRWWRTDHPDQEVTDETIISDEQFIPYLDLVIKYVDRLQKFITEIRQSSVQS